MNLIGIEEHLCFTGAKTQKTECYDLINEVRDTRKTLLKKLIPNYEGEVMATGTKRIGLGNKQEAYNLFNQPYKLYLMFWKINVQVVSVGNDQSTNVGVTV